MKDLDPASFYPPGFRTLTRERPFPHACKLDSVRHAYMTFPDPRDIRRRGGQVPADYQDGKWREAYKKRALYKDGPYVQAAPLPR